MNTTRRFQLSWLLFSTLAATTLVAGVTHAETFIPQAGPDIVGDVVWVQNESLSLMALDSHEIRNIPLSSLSPHSRYRAHLYQRELTGTPTPLELARRAREWGLFDEAAAELSEAARVRGEEQAVAAEMRLLIDAEARRDLDDARSAIAAGKFATAGRLLERLKNSQTSSAAEAASLHNANAAAIDQALVVANQTASTKRAARRLAASERKARHAIERARELIAAADQVRFGVAAESWPVSRSRYALLDAAYVYIRASNVASAAMADIAAGHPLSTELDTVVADANARLVDTYCTLADINLIRGDLIEAYDWASVALAIDPDAECAREIIKTARLGGAIGSDGGGLHFGGGFGGGFAGGHGDVDPAASFDFSGRNAEPGFSMDADVRTIGTGVGKRGRGEQGFQPSDGGPGTVEIPAIEGFDPPSPQRHR